MLLLKYAWGTNVYNYDQHKWQSDEDFNQTEYDRSVHFSYEFTFDEDEFQTPDLKQPGAGCIKLLITFLITIL